MAEPLVSIAANLQTPLLLNSGRGRRHKLSLLLPKTQFLLSSFTLLSKPISADKIKWNSRNSLSCLCSRGAPTKIHKRKTPSLKPPLFSDGRDGDESYLLCMGCGVFMQDENPNLPGYYQKRVSQDENFVEILDDLVEGSDEDEEEIDGSLSKSDLAEPILSIDGGDSETEGFSDKEGEGTSDWDWDSDWETEDEEETQKKELDGFSLPGVGYGNVTEDTLKKLKKDKVSKTEKKRRAREAQRDEEDTAIVCARCHSLRNYGQVKNQKAENLIPDFDFDRLIATRLMKPASTAPVVVMVVDCVDFDGSFPKRAAKSLFKALEGNKKDAKLAKLPRLILVATKVDLLPSQISPTRLDRWVRNRAKSAGAPKLSGVYLVSARKDLGVRNLLSFIKELAGPRGNVWVIGAQNAGKSTLINALAKREGVKITKLTEAPVPGTTLGILRIGGILPAKAKMYDTPGLLHPNLISMRLNREEQKMVEIRKELQPRTFRVKSSVMAEPLVSIAANLQTPLLLNSGRGRRHKLSLLLPKTQFLLSSFTLLSKPISADKIKWNSRNSLSCLCSRGAPTKIHKRKTPSLKPPLFSDGRDGDESYLLCMGCGVFMQDENPNLPGYYQKRVSQDENFVEILDDLVEGSDEDEEEIDGSLSKSDLAEPILSIDGGDSETEGFSDKEGEGTSDWDWDSDWETEDEEETQKKELDGFSLPGVGYGNVTEDTLKKLKKDKVSKTEKKRRAREAQRDEEDTAIVCARCHSLRNYGQVKNQKAENLIPDFDFDRLIATRLMKPASTAPVVVMVVDCVDFDGSFPKRAAKSLFKALEGNKKDAKLAKLPRLILVATKVDLLPSQISPTRLDRWVRNRAKSAGAPKLSGVYLVSARKDLGVRNLLSFIKELAGPRGNVWVIGAQNAGKSTLINALAKREGVKITKLTEAPVPGTTLGILRIGGILPAKAKMYDTPGLLHPNLISMRLNREEQKMVEIRKELQPRTFRVKVGQTVHVGGLIRFDLAQASVETIYITVWSSPNISLHLGKTENADEVWRKHAGVRLQPPIGQDRVSELGDWKQREIKVSGISWEVNSIDIAASGLGWLSLGLKGEATVVLWSYDGVEITQREPLVLDRSRFLEKPGFLLPKAISDAIGNQSKLEAAARKLKDETADSLLEASI